MSTASHERGADRGGDYWSALLRKNIAWGSSTCSKSPNFRPEEPAALVGGSGCRVTDVDGRVFIDYRNGLGPVSLGYAVPEINAAIAAQLENGISFGHPHILEAEVAELLTERIPGFEQVRFLKTGGEAIAACIRLARAFTGRDHIIQIGYNGWLNSLAAGGSTLPGQVSGSAPLGVPAALAELHHAVVWEDRPALEALFAHYSGQIAAVVVAADYARMGLGAEFYPYLKKICRENGALLICDEIVTGMRIAVGGVQEYFGFTADLAVFSKGVANGMPLSVFGGRKDVMALCERGNGVTISSTFGGETLSLAAAKAVQKFYAEHDVVGHIWTQAESLWTQVNELFAAAGIGLEYRGFWPCPTMVAVTDDGRRSVSPADVFRAAYANGVSLYTVSYVNYSHKEADIAETVERLGRAIAGL